MKKFFSAVPLTESGDGLFTALLDLIDSKLVRDRTQILKDISLHESFTGNCARFAQVRVHTSRSAGITDFCLACGETDEGLVEVLILWSDISEHRLEELAELAGFFEKSARQRRSSGEIIAELKNV